MENKLPSTGISREDIRFHVTKLDGVKEYKLQRAFDLRLHGALIHVYDASPQARMRHQKRVKVGRLSIPPEMVSQKKAFEEALKNPGKKYKLSVGPYDLFIKLYQEFVPRQVKLKKENEELRARLEKLERALEVLQEQKKESDALLEHALESKTPVSVKMAGSSRNPRGPGERRLSVKRRPERRSPKHKRVKIPMKIEDAQMQEESPSSTFQQPMESYLQKKAEEERKMATVEQRLQIKIAEYLRKRHDHG